jgi:Uma2 family endonuclease
MNTASKPAELIEPEARRFYTYDEWVAEFPESNQPCELWDGELIMAPSPFFGHQKIALRFLKRLDEFVGNHALGEVVGAPIDMVLSPRRSVQPDVVFIAKEHLDIVRDTIRGPADLVVEIISPGGRHRDRIEKRDLYEQYGVAEYWIIDPEAATVEVLRLNPDKQYALAGRYRLGEIACSSLLQGFEIPVSYIFGR